MPPRFDKTINIAGAVCGCMTSDGLHTEVFSRGNFLHIDEAPFSLYGRRMGGNVNKFEFGVAESLGTARQAFKAFRGLRVTRPAIKMRVDASGATPKILSFKPLGGMTKGDARLILSSLATTISGHDQMRIGTEGKYDPTWLDIDEKILATLEITQIA